MGLSHRWSGRVAKGSFVPVFVEVWFDTDREAATGRPFIRELRWGEPVGNTTVENAYHKMRLDESRMGRRFVAISRPFGGEARSW